jgi:single-stranded-DNA-specific exonuclease
MHDMERVVQRIKEAMQSDERIAIWSDYDMDGIPGAVLLHDLFTEIGYTDVLHYTPHRNKEGFGLNKEGLVALSKKGVKLLITVDCGIGDVDQVRLAHELGMDTIITDHHLPHETLPDAYAILNPKHPSCTYPERMLCGAGVAFKLAQGLLQSLKEDAKDEEHTLPSEGWEKWLLDMAGMATVADMVPLCGENRALAHFGLIVLRKSRRPGLQALLKKARTNQRYLTEDDIGFTIAPRINAASRMGHAEEAFALLTEQDPVRAAERAASLDRINSERKTTVAVMKREIKRRLAKLGEPKDVIVLGNPDWKPSLLGLVAGGLAEEFNRPVFLWGKEEGVSIKGSCRSPGEVSVFEVMKHAEHVFIEYGGHAYSGGFSISDEHIHVLEEALLEAHTLIADDSTTSKVHYADAELTLADVTWETYRALEQLAPFGEGNPKPVFLFRNVDVAGVRRFGKGKEHLELKLTEGKSAAHVKAITFFTPPGAFGGDLEKRRSACVVAHMEVSSFGRTRELRLRLVDLQ